MQTSRVRETAQRRDNTRAKHDNSTTSSRRPTIQPKRQQSRAPQAHESYLRFNFLATKKLVRLLRRQRSSKTTSDKNALSLRRENSFRRFAGATLHALNSSTLFACSYTAACLLRIRSVVRSQKTRRQNFGTILNRRRCFIVSVFSVTARLNEGTFFDGYFCSGFCRPFHQHISRACLQRRPVGRC